MFAPFMRKNYYFSAVMTWRKTLQNTYFHKFPKLWEMPISVSFPQNQALCPKQNQRACTTTSVCAAGGRASELIDCVVVEKIEDQRKLDDFFGSPQAGPHQFIAQHTTNRQFKCPETLGNKGLSGTLCYLGSLGNNIRFCR